MIKRIINKQYSTAVPIIILINIAVFIMWSFPSKKLELEPLFMVKNFLVSWTYLFEEGRIWTLLTSVFSHNMFWHLFLNMYVLLNFGGFLEKILGVKSFLQFYLIAGVFSSFAHCLVSTLFLGEPELPALGASGAISGLILLFSLLFPNQKILIFGIIPVPAIWGSLAFIGLDIWGLIAQVEGGGLPIGHGAHLGGALVGILYYFLIAKSKLKSKITQFI